ncbi:MAG: hypothetical protein QY322_00960 [bacterium]|nr:MAG: hypothetical protein QY322_00960 [bacterium]
MKFSKPVAKNDLEGHFLDQVEKDTPLKVKDNILIDLNNRNKFELTLYKDQLSDFDLNTPGLGIQNWFESYREEAKVSTAGIRGLQNPLYPWDTRYPLNLVGVALATMGKVLVAMDINNNKEKIVASEVRYNSKQYVELIARIQSAYGIKTYLTEDYQTIPIFLISFIIFMYDLYGGEYVTSSHAMCKKIATKDLNTQGSQYIPSESLKFVEKIEKILKVVNKKGKYSIKFSSIDDKNMDFKFLKSINNGIDDYIEYLKKGVATNVNISAIKTYRNRLIIDSVGGSLTNTFLPVLKSFEIDDKFQFIHSEEDSFNHGVGKMIGDDGSFFDWGCDTTIVNADLKTSKIKTPVIETIKYNDLLKDYPIGTVVLITDPDADRLVTAVVESEDKVEVLQKLGVVYSVIGDNRILVLFTPNQSFLMNIDFQKMALENAKLWTKYDWFILKTSASQRSWDEWAIKNNIPVINTPVGFKELADTMINIERKIENSAGQDIFINDVYGKSINIGKKPRMLFAGEESGGEIFGPPELILSKNGRMAISMREKSAGEAIIITSAMVSCLDEKHLTLVDYLASIFEKNKIVFKYEIRINQKYYNESEPDIKILLQEKEKGMQLKTNNNSYFLSLALGHRDNLITIDQVREILNESLPGLIFDDLSDIMFCGDGTYFLFNNKCMEVRPSGTDAVNKAYCYGKDQWENIKYAQSIAQFNGTRNRLHKKYISDEFYNNAVKYSFQLYTQYKQSQ